MARNKELTVRDVVQLVKGGCINEYGRVSIHLHNSMGCCVYDLDCEIEDMPSIVWREVLDCVGGVTIEFRLPGVGFVEHVDYCRFNGTYGVPLVDVYEDISGCYWTNDAGQRLYCYQTPTIWTAYYYDTAFNKQYCDGANARVA